MRFADIIKNLRKENGMTQTELAKKLGLTRSSLSMYELGEREPSFEILEAFADFFNVDMDYLLGRTDKTTKILASDSSEPAAATGHNMSALSKQILDKLKPVKMKSFPMLGYVACGEPIFADKNYEAFVMADADIDADYCLTCKGDSMINARIYDGDTVFIKSCSMVDNGDIALVVIDNDVTLKRVYYYPEQQTLKLVSENPLYAPFVYSGAELEQIRILGKAVMFQSIVR